MKKLIYCAAALATAFFAASCQQENFEPVGGPVTFTVTAPGDLDTRAIADGTNVDEVHWAVYKNVEGVVNSLYTSTEKPLAQGIVPMENKAATLELDLLQDQEYTILFWAQVAGTEYYTVGDLREVKINATTVAANNESRAAFFKRHNFNTSTQQNYEVTLVRPFAQINLGTTLASLSPVQQGEEYGHGYTIDVQKSQMVVKGIASSFSLVTGEGKNEAVDFTFTSTATPAKAQPVEKLFVNDVEYHYVGMNYLVIPIEDKTVTVSYEITTDKGNITNTINNVPVKENYRTNIIGNLLTSKTDFEIVVDERFIADNNITPISVSTPEGLQDAIDNIEAGAAGTIKLEGNITLGALTKSATEEPKFITIPVGSTTTIDLNGYSLTGVDDATGSFGLINNKGTLTIINTASNTSTIALEAKIDREWNAYSSVISNTVGGNLLVKGNVLVEHLGGTSMAYGIDNLTNGKGTSAVTTVEGATVKSTYRAIRQFLNGVEATNELYVKNGSKIYGPDNKSIWMQDPSKNANTGKLVVEKGAELYGDVYLTVTAGSTEWPVEVSIAESALKGESTVLTSNVPARYELVNSNGVWTVETTIVEEGDVITLTTAKALREIATQVNAGENYFDGKTIKLGADIDLNNEEWSPIGSAATDHGFMGNFDGNGYTIKNLKMTQLTADADNYVYAGLFGVTEGAESHENYIKNLVIENVTIETAGHIVAAAIAYPYYTTVENVTVKGDISIKGGDYTSGVLAYTRRCVNAENITIVGNPYSVIEGNRTIGGVISDIQMNGGLTANYSNFSASGLTIKGVMHVGGISGIICRQTLDGATVKNVSIVCDDNRKGIVSGSLGDKNSYITNLSYENVTGATRVIGGTFGDGLVIVTTADELVAALEDNQGVYFMNDIEIDPAKMSNAYGKTGINVKNGQTIDGNGYTLNINGAGGTWDSGINTTGGLIKNLTVTGSFRGIFINHTSDHSEKVVLQNVTIGGEGIVYTISCDQGLYQGIEATNCTFNGWTSFAKTAGEAKFVNCSFGEGNGYKYCRPYSNTEFVKCTFCPGYSVDTTRAEVTFTDCTFEE